MYIHIRKLLHGSAFAFGTLPHLLSPNLSSMQFLPVMVSVWDSAPVLFDLYILFSVISRHPSCQSSLYSGAQLLSLTLLYNGLYMSFRIGTTVVKFPFSKE